MRALILLSLLLAACSHHNSEPAPLLGPVSELRARTDAVRCTKKLIPTNDHGEGRYACAIDLGPCGCNLQVHVSTAERGSQSLVDLIMIDISNCADGTGLAESEQLIRPYLSDAQYSSLHDLLTRPRLDRTPEERAQYGVFQEELFGNVRVQTTFDADLPTPTRTISVDTVRYRTAAKLVPRAFHSAPCNNDVK
jgi:hypothetical protein